MITNEELQVFYFFDLCFILYFFSPAKKRISVLL